MSIDSHFEVTENKDNSVRLHLPNYKGNQPMDFHIYLMEPFLFISFVTEIEGEKVSTVNSYPKDMNQQDMFNAAMASNLEKLRQNIVEKDKKDNCNFVSTDDKESASKPVKERKETIGIINSWSLLAFAKEHGKMQVGDFANKDTGEVFKACIFTKPDGTRTFVAFAAKMGELTPKQIAEMKNELQVVQLESGNYSLCKIGSNSWQNVDLENSDNKDIESLSTKVAENNLENTRTDGFGVEYSSDMKSLKRAPHEIIDYSILDGTEIISDASFSNCESLVSVSIPRSVKAIGHYAFAGCKKIFSIVIPDEVVTLGDGSFMNCETLKALRLPASLTSISDDTFDGCKNLNTIFVPVEEKIRFESMLSKFNVNIAEYNSDNVSSLDELLNGLLDESGVLYSKDGKVVFTHTRELSEYSVKEGTEFINNKAFSPIEGVDADFFSLKEIYLPDSVVTIGEQAFANNEGLQEITLPTSIKSIGKDAFLGCKSLNIIRIPYGTGAKFKKLLPEWKDKFVEKDEEVIDTLYGFKLPDGSLYNGSCIRKPFGTIELDGIGSVLYPNGDKYKGNFKYGRPYGWGIYWFANGHKHKGFFDNQPRGIGYLDEDYNMAVGNFFEGRLHGWAICYRNRVFKFGFWENDKLVQDETDKTLWVRCEISNLRAQYHSNLVQISQGHELIRFGIPERTINIGVKTPNSPIWPAVGFEFFKDGTVKVGEIKNNASGNYILCKKDGTMEIGHWKENVKDVEKTLIDFQGSVGIYEVDGLDVYKNESSSHTCYPDDYYLKKYSKTREEYFRENYNEVSCLTAKCLRNKSESWVHEDYSELEIGKTYKVTHIGVFRSFTRIMLEGFGDKEYNSVCFEIFENGKSIDKRYTKDVRFLAPYLRERLKGKSEND